VRLDQCVRRGIQRCYTGETRHPIRVTAGDGLIVRADTVHVVRNVGGGNAAELATYVVEKERPLFVIVG
jgi:hypothetical protein